MRCKPLAFVACVFFAACGDDSQATLAIALPESSRLGQLPPESVEQLRLTLEIEGLLAESPLTLDLEAGVARGSFVVPDGDATVSALARLYGARDALSEEVLLGYSLGSVTIESGDANTIQFPPLITSDDPALDLNRNGRSNLDDLLGGLDPNLLPNPIRVAPETLNLGSETNVGDFSRSFVVISNDSNEQARVSLETRLAPGVSLTVLEDLFALGPVPSAPTLEFDLDANDQQVVAVTFAPSNARFLVGALTSSAELTFSNTRYASALSLLANPDGIVSRPPSDYALPALPEELAGYRGPLEAYPIAPLWSGAPVIAGISEADAGSIGGQDIDRAYWVFVPRGHRFSITLDELPEDADLYAWRIVDGAVEDRLDASTSAGTSAESLIFTAAEDTLLVIGIDRIQSETAATLTPTATEDEPLSATLQATLLSVPEFLPSCAEEDPDCVPPVETSSPCPDSYGESSACAAETGGGEMVLRGTNFRPGGRVMLAGFNAICSEVIATGSFDEIRCIVPPARVDPRISPRATLIYENPDGESAVLPEGFAYVPPAPSPTATSLGTGPETGGSVITVSVSNLFEQGTDQPLIRFGDVPGQILNVTAGSLTAVTPECIGCGVVDVTVINPDGQAGTLVGSFEFAPPATLSAPTLAAIEPDIGRTEGGEEVQISGTGFLSGLDVRFGTRSAPVLAAADTSITVLTPAGSAGTVEVRITNPDGGAATLPDAFSYRVPPPSLTAVIPAAGREAGGNPVTLIGLDFRAGARVFFGDQEATAVAVNGATGITCSSPPGQGTVDVSVRQLDGSTATLPAAYAYEPPINPMPTIGSIVPASGSVTGGTEVTVTGTGFVEGAVVFFGGQAALGVRRTSESELIAISPATIPTGEARSVELRVTLPDGQSGAVQNGFAYVVLPPTVVSAQPASGPSSGGTTVVVTGSGFRPDARVLFRGVPASQVSVVSAQTLIATSPPNGVGAVDLEVLNTNGQSGALGDGFFYTPPAPESLPSIASLTPGTGSFEGGTAVEIIGERIDTAARVFFGSSEAAVLSVTADGTGLVALSPPGAAGQTVTVKVQNPDGQSASSSFSYGTEANRGSVQAVIPDQGPAAAITTVLIAGQEFSANPRVFVEDASGWQTELLGAVAVSSSIISARVPAYGGPLSGPEVAMRVIVDDAKLEQGFSYLNAPLKLVSVSPRPDGPLSAGEAVRVVFSEPVAIDVAVPSVVCAGCTFESTLETTRFPDDTLVLTSSPEWPLGEFNIDISVDSVRDGDDSPENVSLIAVYSGVGECSRDPSWGTLGTELLGPGSLNWAEDAGLGTLWAAGSDRSGSDEAGVVYRLQRTGGPDPAFGDGGRVLFPQAGEDTQVIDGAALDDGVALLLTGPSGPRVEILTSSGASSAAFATPELAAAQQLAADRSGRLLVAGNGQVAAYAADGSSDPSFGTNGVVRLSDLRDALEAMNVGDLQIQGNGALVLAGTDTQGRAVVVRLNPDGSLEGGLDSVEPGTSSAQGVLIRGDGRIAVFGSIRVRGDEEGAMWQFNPDGSPDTSFTPNGRFTQSDALLTVNDETQWLRGFEQEDGSVVIAGNTVPPTGTRIGLWVLTADGRALSAFNREERALELSRLAGADGSDQVRDMVQLDGQAVLVGSSRDASDATVATATAIEPQCTVPSVSAVYAVPAPDGTISFSGDEAAAGTAAEPTSLAEGLDRVRTSGGELRLIAGTYRLEDGDPDLSLDISPLDGTVTHVEVLGGYGTDGARDPTATTAILDERTSGESVIVVSGTGTQLIVFDRISLTNGELLNSKSILAGRQETRLIVRSMTFGLRGLSTQAAGVEHRRAEGSVVAIDNSFVFVSGLTAQFSRVAGVRTDADTSLYAARNVFSGRGREGTGTGQWVTGVETFASAPGSVWIRDSVFLMGAGDTGLQSGDTVAAARLGGDATFTQNTVTLLGAQEQIGVQTNSITGDRLIVGNTFSPAEASTFRHDAILARGSDGAYGVTHFIRNNVVIVADTTLSNGIRAETGGTRLFVQNNTFIIEDNGFALKLGVNSGTAAPIQTDLENNIFVQPTSGTPGLTIDSRGMAGIRSEILSLRYNTFFNAPFVLSADENPFLAGSGCPMLDASDENCSVEEINALGPSFDTNELVDPVLDDEFRPTDASPCSVVSGGLNLTGDIERDRDGAARTPTEPSSNPGISRGAFEYDGACVP